MDQVVCIESITALFDTVDSEDSVLRALTWWAERVPIHKDPQEALVKHVVKEAARVAYTNVLDWLIARVPFARFDVVLNNGAMVSKGKDPRRVVEWLGMHAQWQLVADTSTGATLSMGEWIDQG